MPTIKVEDTAFVRYGAPDLQQMKAFLLDFGMVEVRATPDRLWMRGSGAAPFVHVTERGEAGFRALGFRARSVEDLAKLAAREGVPVEPLDDPGGGSVVRLRDPGGYNIEVVAGQQAAPRRQSGVRQSWNVAENASRLREAKRVTAGPSTVLRLGHVAIIVDEVKRSWDWYADRLGLLSSDEAMAPEGGVAAVFLRCDLGANPADHHSLNLASAPGAASSFHHAAFEVGDLDDLMAGHQFLTEHGYRHRWGVGRHNVGSQVFDYWADPWGHRLEHWTDGDLFTADDPAQVVDLPFMLGSQWGPPIPGDFL